MVTQRTLTAYESDWRTIRNVLGDTIPASPNTLTDPMTVDQVLAYMHNAQVSASTIERRLAAIRYYHNEARLISPTYHPDVADALAVLELNQDPNQRRANSITHADMLKILTALDSADTTPAKKARDRAMMLVGWFGRMERGEIAGLDIGDYGNNGRTWTVQIRAKRNIRVITTAREPGTLDVADAITEWMRYLPDRGELFRRVDRWENILDSRISGQTGTMIVQT